MSDSFVVFFVHLHAQCLVELVRLKGLFKASKAAKVGTSAIHFAARVVFDLPARSAHDADELAFLASFPTFDAGALFRALLHFSALPCALVILELRVNAAVRATRTRMIAAAYAVGIDIGAQAIIGLFFDLFHIDEIFVGHERFARERR